MKIFKLTTIAILGLATISYGQSTNSFCLAIGGSGSESATGITKTSDNGSILCGYTNSYGAGSYDCYFVKLDSVGQIEWTKTIGGTAIDKAHSIVQTSDGGYAFTGITQSFGAGGNDVYVGKLTSTGSLVWTKTIGGASSDYGNSIIETSDGGLAIAGWYGLGGVDYDVYLIKMDALGNIAFSNTYGGAAEDIAYSIFENVDGSFILSGYSTSFGAGQKDGYILKVSSIGTLVWTKTIGGSLNEEAYSIIECADGGFAFAGVTQSFGAGGNDCYLVKLDAAGNLSWTKTIGGLNSDYFKSIKQKSNGNIIASGWYGINAGNYDLYFCDFTNSGSFVAGKTVGSTGVETGQGLIVTSNDCIIIAGYSDSLGSGSSDMYVVQFDSVYNICSACNPSNSVGTQNLGGTTSSGGTSGIGGTISSGGTIGSGGNLTLICQNINVGLQENEIQNLFSIFPNPTSNLINIYADKNFIGSTYKIYDNLGRNILSGKMISENTQIDLNNLSAGIYLISIGESMKQYYKVIKE